MYSLSKTLTIISCKHHERRAYQDKAELDSPYEWNSLKGIRNLFMSKVELMAIEWDFR